jgi:hypothetical protein
MACAKSLFLEEKGPGMNGNHDSQRARQNPKGIPPENALRLVGECILGILCFAGIIYGVRSRTLWDLLYNSGLIAAIIALLYVIGGIVLWYKEPYRRNWPSAIQFVIAGAIGIPLVAAVYYEIGVAIEDFALWAISVRSKTIVVPLSVFVFGSILYYCRFRFRSLYGLTEVLIGVVVAVSRVSTISDAGSAIRADFLLALLTAGVYLVVRGFDNVHQGVTRPPLDPIGVAVVAWLRHLPQSNRVAKLFELHEKAQ